MRCQRPPTPHSPAAPARPPSAAGRAPASLPPCGPPTHRRTEIPSCFSCSRGSLHGIAALAGRDLRGAPVHVVRSLHLTHRVEPTHKVSRGKAPSRLHRNPSDLLDEADVAALVTPGLVN